ncbi:glutathione peroxidase [Novosphingobium chloroacetimidivorans]|uniref:Glutathione peroxidase n=1 Tax=Novosphingobium chloroacetimidivorans TaxID=1428314 RepID=A0A7W7NY30_9SPHN|nr:glutathione peroxidase [Novosphingobium chloroacetimidivorans]MBB4859777.1 glutathione peroxidase [Novosphingobium chloroacetimidivorans]
MKTIADFAVTAGNGAQVSLADKAGKVLLVVNTASRCGLTPQYTGLEGLWQAYRDRGFEVLAFPCNQFANQEPAGDAEIATFCDIHFGLSFPLMSKVDVNGPDAAPLFEWLKSEAPGIMGTRGIKWNFTKFLIGRDGKVVRRYAPAVKPESISRDIEALLG